MEMSILKNSQALFEPPAENRCRSWWQGHLPGTGNGGAHMTEKTLLSALYRSLLLSFFALVLLGCSGTPAEPPAEDVSKTPVPTTTASALLPSPAPETLSEEAKTSYEKALGGDLEGQYNMGIRYLNGDGVEKDVTQALVLLENSADKGNANAQFGLGYLYAQGQGVEKNPSRAVELYEAAAAQGHLKAISNLAMHCESGEGLSKDVPRAAELYRKVAEQGDTLAQLNLAMLYEEGGEGLEPD